MKASNLSGLRLSVILVTIQNWNSLISFWYLNFDINYHTYILF